jgi:hypothetical protein
VLHEGEAAVAEPIVFEWDDPDPSLAPEDAAWANERLRLVRKP